MPFIINWANSHNLNIVESKAWLYLKNVCNKNFEFKTLSSPIKHSLLNIHGLILYISPKEVESQYIKSIQRWRNVTKSSKLIWHQCDMVTFSDIILILDINNLSIFNNRKNRNRCEMVQYSTKNVEWILKTLEW